MVVLRSEAFEDWLDGLPLKQALQVRKRLQRIETEAHFGHSKRLSSLLWELKFNNGCRIYYTLLISQTVIVLIVLGGNKNGQSKDITQAQNAVEKIHQENS